MKILFALILFFNQISIEKNFPLPETSSLPEKIYVDREEMEKIGTFYPEEALSFLPGIYTTASGGYLGSPALYFVRGSQPNSSPVFVEGVLVRSLGTGQANINMFPFSLIERIEVFKGPSVFIFGSESTSGAINIRFPDFLKENSAEIMSNYRMGKGAGLRTTLGVGRSYGQNLTFYLAGSYETTGNAITAGDFTGYGVLLGGEGGNRKWKVKLKSLYSERTSEMGFKYSFSKTMKHIINDPQSPYRFIGVIDPDLTNGSTFIFTKVQEDFSFSDDFKLTFSQFHERVRETQTDSPAEIFSDSFDFDGDVLYFKYLGERAGGNISFYHTYKNFVKTNLFLGGEWERFNVRCASNYPFCGAEDVNVFTLERGIAYAGINSETHYYLISLLINGRADIYERSGAVFNGEGKIILMVPYLPESLRLYISGSTSTGKRMPRLDELYMGETANPELKPERSLLKELTLRVEGGFSSFIFKTSFTYFKNDFKDLIILKWNEDKKLLMKSNEETTISEGFETGIKAEILDILEIGESLTFLNMRKPPDNAGRVLHLDYVPDILSNSNILFSLSGFSLLYQIQYMGDWWSHSYINYDGKKIGPGGRYKQEGWTLHNIFMKYEFPLSRNTQMKGKLFFKIFNILNENYILPGGFPGIPFTFEGGIGVEI